MMDQTEILSYLRKKYPQLGEPKLQQEISEAGQLMQFRSGWTILDYGQYVKFVPLIVEGSIKVLRQDEKGRELFLYYLNPGETCSMSFSCCMMQKKSQIKTSAEEDTIIIAIPVKYADQWLSKYATWRNYVMQSYDNRMYEMVRTIDSIAFQKMDERLIKYLKRKKEATNSHILHATHQEIANDLNASREAVSRLLKKLEIDGLIALRRNEIELIDQNT